MRTITTKPRSKKAPKRVLALPDLEQSKAAVLNSLTSASGQRTYDHAIREFVAWYCSEPRLAFNRTVVLLCKHTEENGAFGLVVNRPLVTTGRIVVNLDRVTRRQGKDTDLGRHTILRKIHPYMSQTYKVPMNCAMLVSPTVAHIAASRSRNAAI